MMIPLLKTYTLRVTIQEGNDEFWEGLRGKTGADEIVKSIRDLLEEGGWWNSDVRLERFEEKPYMEKIDYE